MFIFIIILSVLVQGLIALFVLQKNYKSPTNILFFTLSFFLACWATINFVITKDPFSSSQLVLYRLLMGTVVLQNVFFLLFAHTYPGIKINLKRRFLTGYFALSVVTLVVALSPFLFVSVKYGSSGARPQGGPGMIIFIIHAAISVYLGLRVLYRQTHSSRAATRQQFQLIFYASIILWGIVPITNFGISMATQTLFFARVSPIYTLAFSSIIAYAIVARKLFNIRAAVARSVAYLLLLGSIGVVYAIGLFGIINVFFGNESQQLLRQILTICLLTPLAIGFQGAKGFFDRVTNKVFYRDSYDFQLVLDELGSMVAEEIDLHKLLTSTRMVLSNAIKPSFVEFVLFKDGNPYLEGNSTAIKQHSIAVISSQMLEQHKDLIVTEELTLSNPLRHSFHESNIAICLRLKTQHEMVGCLLIGEKRSGDIYSNQDQRLLSISSRELAIAIQNALHFQEIADFNRTLQDKVDEATRKLRNANHRLTELDETKDDFISMASHQLRTPLTSVKGYLSLVLEGDAGKITPIQRKMLGQAFTSSQHMVYLIADLLNVSRLKTGKFVIDAIPSNLGEVVQEEIDQLKEVLDSHSLKLVYNKPHNFPELMLDETKTRQVIMNFVDNAIYYTPAGGVVTVELLDKPSSVELRVIDNGIGVPKAEQHHLFTKFYRAGNARKARPDGTGLGLFMAKKVVIAQGGSIIFESSEGKGSVFGFNLPKANHHIPAPGTGHISAKGAAAAIPSLASGVEKVSL